MQQLPFTEAAAIVSRSLDIVAIVAQNVRLKKAGRNYSGLCPFHAEKSPSFTVNREKNLFKCFGCGVGGDALTYLMKRDNRTYGEVIRELAEAQSIEILAERGQDAEAAAQQRDHIQQLLALNQAAQTWFMESLQQAKGETVRQYLQQRDCSPDLQARFGLGFAPPGWDNLLMHLHPQRVQHGGLEMMIQAGLAVERQSDGSEQTTGAYDRFRNRLMIPIYDERGRLVGFGGRALSDEDKPKYMNSPETPLFVKSRVLYGLSLAKEAIRASKSAVIMEGYFDVIAAHAAGITEAVASCGTALTESHLKLLTRFGAETLYLAFDADKAGQNAALSAIELLETQAAHLDLRVKVIAIPNGKDPDDFIRSVGYTQGGELFRGLMAKAASYLTFKLDKTLREVNVLYPDSRSPEYRVEASSRAAVILAKVQHPVLREDLTRSYAAKIGVSEEAMALEVQRQNPRFSQSSVVPFQKSFQKRHTDKSFSKQAISDHALPSLNPTQFTGWDTQRDHSMPSSGNLLSTPSPRRALAEGALFSLLFLNDVTPKLMLPYCSSSAQLNPVFLHPALSTLWGGVETILNGLSGPILPDLLERMSRWIQELSEVTETQRANLQGVLADRGLAAAHALESLKLTEETGALFAAKVHKVAAQYRGVLEQETRRAYLGTLAAAVTTLEKTVVNDTAEAAEELEGEMLQHHYQLQNQLKDGTQPMSSVCNTSLT